MLHAIRFSIKCASTCAPKTANFKKFLLLFSHRVTRIRNRESKTFFASNAHVRPINEREVLFLNIMKKSKSLFSQLHKKAILYGLVDEGGWFSQVLASRKTTAEHTKLTNCVNLCLISLRALVPLWLKFNQSKMINYAKQSQFPKCQKCS